ncbi:purine nucleoside phosphorylase isoform X2 [Neodiprion lecontei]|uniref:purine-nucleoside phosphorylase n=1 Tax=Neodiprion lecontei TaxID=441921 RepID=A0ABM3G177_NEOLC|nr:purine nucleoside phosphorylase isoform X2 [Neodiprion pinetum]XP_046594015.1 purine nucleoside phosphorylase isoform X2 [Neodiprion lecontei]
MSRRHLANGHATATAAASTADAIRLKKQENELVDVAANSVYTFEALEESANYLLERTSIRPKIAVICGSGMGSLADALTDKVCFAYESIPHFPVSTVPGHMGQLVFGFLRGVPIMCMQGRFHYYEGYPLWKCSMPVRVMKLVGASHLIATNAAGGLNPNYKIGDIMMMRDHVNMMGFAGNNPLQGPNDDRHVDGSRGHNGPALRHDGLRLQSDNEQIANGLRGEPRGESRGGDRRWKVASTAPPGVRLADGCPRGEGVRLGWQMSPAGHPPDFLMLIRSVPRDRRYPGLILPSVTSQTPEAPSSGKFCRDGYWRKI